MTSSTSKSIPFIVMAIAGVAFAVEAAYDIELDLEALIPILAPMGVAGAAKAMVQNASAIRKAMPEEIKKIIQDEMGRVVPKRDGFSNS